MKNTALKLLWCTSAFLVIFVILSQTEISLTLILSLFAIGQLLVLVTVYKILTDKYDTNKSFKDWYEDHPKQH